MPQPGGLPCHWGHHAPQDELVEPLPRYARRLPGAVTCLVIWGFSDNYLKEDSVCLGALVMVDSCQFIFESNNINHGFKRFRKHPAYKHWQQIGTWTWKVTCRWQSGALSDWVKCWNYWTNEGTWIYHLSFIFRPWSWYKYCTVYLLAAGYKTMPPTEHRRKTIRTRRSSKCASLDPAPRNDTKAQARKTCQRKLSKRSRNIREVESYVQPAARGCHIVSKGSIMNDTFKEGSHLTQRPKETAL